MRATLLLSALFIASAINDGYLLNPSNLDYNSLKVLGGFFTAIMAMDLLEFFVKTFKD